MILILDTETEKNNLVYDLSYIIIDRNKNIIKTRSFLIKEIFNMQNFSIGNKATYYLKNYINKRIFITEFMQAEKTFFNDLEKYKVKEILSYNITHDKLALATTGILICRNSRLFTSLMIKISIGCIWSMACSTIGITEKYQRFCIENGYISDSNNIYTGLEYFTRFIKNDIEYNQQHTGIMDCIDALRVYRNINLNSKNLRKNSLMAWYTCNTQEWKNKRKKYKLEMEKINNDN